MAFLVGRELSQRRACELLGVGRRWLGYRGKRARTDDPVLPRLKELAARHPRYGYRRLWGPKKGQKPFHRTGMTR